MHRDTSEHFRLSCIALLGLPVLFGTVLLLMILDFFGLPVLVVGLAAIFVSVAAATIYFIRREPRPGDDAESPFKDS